MNRKGVVLFALVLMLTLMVACNNKTPSLSVDETELIIEVGDSSVIKANITGTSKSLELLFESDNPDIAKITNNTIKAISVGNTVITVSIKDFPDISKKIIVDVVARSQRLYLNGESTVVVGSNITLIAEDKNSTDNIVLWESSDKSILTVDQNGVVTGVGVGTAKIIITSKITSEKLEKEITVDDPEISDIEIAGLNIFNSWVNNNLKLEVNDNCTININIIGTSKSLELLFESDNPDIAKITNNTIKAISVGNTVITVSIKDFPDISKKIIVDVVARSQRLYLNGESTVVVGSNITLIAEDKNSTDNIVLWESSDKSILTVDQNGVVTGVGVGTAKVIITSKITGEKLEKEITVEKIEISDLSITGLNIFNSWDKNKLNLEVMDTGFINANIKGSARKLELLYESNAPDVAKITNKTIEAISVGSAIITVSIKEYPSIKEDINVTVKQRSQRLYLNGEDTVIFELPTTLVAEDKNSIDNLVLWESSDENILTVDQNGVVTGVSVGTARIIITSKITGEKLEKEITVIYLEATGIEIDSLENTPITLSTIVKLNARVLPKGAYQDIIWFTSNDRIATVDSNGTVTPHSGGEVTIFARVSDSDILGKITFTITPTPLEVISFAHVEHPVVKYDVMFWGSNNPENNLVFDVFGSVNNYYFGNITIDSTSYVLTSNYNNYSGIGINKVRYIVVHDTANANSGARNNAAYLLNPANEASWHYTVGNDGIFKSLPHNIVGWHAGEKNAWELRDTRVKATTTVPELSIVKYGDNYYWAFNGVRSVMQVAKNAPLVDNGIYTEIGSNGNYYIGKTYYNSTYNRIANGGGNMNGIGIETAMNNGSDIYKTWQYTAKLVSSLMVEHDLGIERVRPHNFFAGKDCPRTMRNAHLWNNFLDMVETEYLFRTYLKDYTIEFTSNDLNYIDNFGRIIDLPIVETAVSYNIKITDSTGKSETHTFYSTLPAKKA